MVKFRLPSRAAPAQELPVMTAVTMGALAKSQGRAHQAASRQNSIGPNSVKFDKNFARIRVDFGQNHRVVANDNFKPVC
jgi:hypothetical protein